MMKTMTKSERPQLSPRRLQVLGLLAKGLQAQEIAGVLGISHQTARDTVKALYKHLGVRNAPEAVSEGYQLGYLKVIE